MCQASSQEIIEHNAPATRQAFQLGQWLPDIEATKTQETKHQREQGYWDGTVRQQHAGYFIDDNRCGIFCAEKLFRLTCNPYPENSTASKHEDIDWYR